MTLTYTATFHVQAGKTGGTIQFLYTWNNGRASPSGSVTVPPNGPSTVTFTYTATGQVGGAYAFPGVAQVNVTSPNVVQSNQVIPTGACTASSPGPTPPINALWMSDATTGWARTTTHLILRTTDGGKSWQVVSSPNPGTGNNLLNGVVVVSATNPWAAGTYSNNGYSQTLIEEYS
jgi:photosystem II stability/assembly factor-like uncharacterized protein